MSRFCEDLLRMYGNYSNYELAELAEEAYSRYLEGLPKGYANGFSKFFLGETSAFLWPKDTIVQPKTSSEYSGVFRYGRVAGYGYADNKVEIVSDGRVYSCMATSLEKANIPDEVIRLIRGNGEAKDQICKERCPFREPAPCMRESGK